MTGETYAASGVDIAAGEEAVRRIGPAVARTLGGPGVMGGIGGFGGCFDLAAVGMRDPVLVSSTDGVGTKAMVAAATARYDTIGRDLVAMCVDDLVCTGARPLFLLDYVAVGSLDPVMVEALVSGVADGCVRAGCALIGGEMAEHPGVMGPGEFDLVGFAVGAVERDRMLDPGTVVPGDLLVGLHSPGLRSNGYSLARRVLLDRAGRALDAPAWDGSPQTMAEVLLEPSVIYAPAVTALLAALPVRSLAHITGGGIVGNLPRALPAGVHAVIDRAAWTPPRVFAEIAALGQVTEAEMAATFNLGIGMVAVVAAPVAAEALSVLGAAGVPAAVIGTVAAGAGAVRLV
jgi:phosphoribosylformylglycinamidine cyclo-ligase